MKNIRTVTSLLVRGHILAHSPTCTLKPQTRSIFGKFLSAAQTWIRVSNRGLSTSLCLSLHQHINSCTMEGRKMTICIEGNIGSGKTMLLDYLSSQTDDVQVIPEPVNTWQNVRGHNMLGLLYDDPVKWSFAFQSYVQLSMLTIHQIPHTRPLKMMERSIFSAKYCFVENLRKSGNISDPEYAVLTEWFNWIVGQYIEVDQIIYLRTTPEHCHRRIQKRNRNEETGISLDYLHKLDELHEDWLVHGTSFPIPAPVMVIDANRPIKDMLQYFKDHREDILFQKQGVIQT